MISEILGPCFPYFASAGNHDDSAWDGPDGYQAVLEARMGCPADLDGDCALDVNDLLVLLGLWGTDPGGPPDYDDNGAVDVLDLLFQLHDWPLCL